MSRTDNRTSSGLLKYQPLPLQLWVSMLLSVRQLNEAVIVCMEVLCCCVYSAA